MIIWVHPLSDDISPPVHGRSVSDVERIERSATTQRASTYCVTYCERSCFLQDSTTVSVDWTSTNTSRLPSFAPAGRGSDQCFGFIAKAAKPRLAKVSTMAPRRASIEITNSNVPDYSAITVHDKNSVLVDSCTQVPLPSCRRGPTIPRL